MCIFVYYIFSNCNLVSFSSAIPLSDPKSEPEIYFFEVVGQCNTIFHLFEKQYTDSFLPLVRYKTQQLSEV